MHMRRNRTVWRVWTKRVIWRVEKSPPTVQCKKVLEFYTPRQFSGAALLKCQHFVQQLKLFRTVRSFSMKYILTHEGRSLIYLECLGPFYTKVIKNQALMSTLSFFIWMIKQKSLQTLQNLSDQLLLYSEQIT